MFQTGAKPVAHGLLVPVTMQSMHYFSSFSMASCTLMSSNPLQAVPGIIY